MSTTESTPTRSRVRVHPPTVTDMTGDDMFVSLTGFDEIAIKDRFGVPVNTIVSADQLQLGRALVFVHLRRQGAKDSEAFKAAQALTIGETVDYFADAETGDGSVPDDLAADGPVSEPGKGAGRHTVRLETSPPGV